MVMPSQGYFSKNRVAQHTASNQRVWNPGHYMTLYASITDLVGGALTAQANTIYTAMSTRPAIKGPNIAIIWSEVETAYGVYDTAMLDAHAARCAADGKHMCIKVSHKTFGGEHAVPSYMQAGVNDALYGDDDGEGTGTSTGGEFETSVGYTVKLNNEAVFERFLAFIDYIGARYNSNPAVEMLYFNEGATGVPVNFTITTEVENNFYANFDRLGAAAKRSAPLKVVAVLFNYPADRLSTMYAEFIAAGVGLADPDVFTSTSIGETDDSDPINQNIKLAGAAAAFSPPNNYDRAYTYHADAHTKIPIVSIISPNSWEYSHALQTTPPTYLPPATATELFAFCRDELNSTHIFWYYNNVTPAAYNAGTAYDYRDLVTSGNIVYQSKPAGKNTNTGNAVGNVTYWHNLGTNFPAITNQFYPLMDTLAALEGGGLNVKYPALL